MEFEILPIFAWAWIPILQGAAAVAAVVGTGYGVAASADAARRQKNAMSRAEARAQTEMEANLAALQELDGGTSAADLSNAARQGSFNRTWIYIIAAAIGAGVLWLVVGKKRKK